MPALVIKDLPKELHARLRDEAALQHRSMTRQAIAILERALTTVPSLAAVSPVRGAFPLSAKLVRAAKSEGRR